MEIGRKLIHGSKRKYTFEYDKGIFVITYKHLVNLERMKNIDDITDINIPLPIRSYSVVKYAVLFLGKDGKMKFLYNPKDYSLIKDISKEFYEFITENYDKI
jgi:hypothetical protein